MIPLLVVFDTNILFSGMSWRGSPYFCLQLARAGLVKSITCREILVEFEEKLQQKRNLTLAQVARAVTEILSFSELVKITNTLRVVQHDPDDDKVLESAVVGKVDYIVSGDHHLIELVTYQSIPIIRAVELLGKVKAG